MYAGRGLRAPASRERGRGLAKAGRARRRLGNARASAGPGRASLLLVASEAEGLARRSCGGVSGCWYRACRGHPLLVMRGQAWGRAVRRRVSGEKSRGSDVGGELGLRRFRKSWRLLFFPFSLLLFMYEGGQEGSCLGPPPLFFYSRDTNCPVPGRSSESEEIRPPRLRSLAETSHSNCKAPEQAPAAACSLAGETGEARRCGLCDWHPRPRSTLDHVGILPCPQPPF